MHHMNPLPRARELRTQARLTLSGHYAHMLWLTLIALLFGAYHLLCPAMPPSILDVSPIFDIIREVYSLCATIVHHVGIHLPHYGDFFVRLNDWNTLLWTVFVCTWALQLLWLLIGHTVRAGLLRCQIARIDNAPCSTSVLFSCFGELFWKALWLKILKALCIFAWSLLLIVPSIIAAYRYSMAEYALCENPTMRATDALRESARMMRGNKWRLFCLRFSFVGWQLLGLLAPVMGSFLLSPYIGQAHALFYHHVSGRAAIREAVEELAEIGEGL
jgi:uncharacterized membrane protein